MKCELHQTEKHKTRSGFRNGVQRWRHACLECDHEKRGSAGNHPGKRAWDRANKAKRSAHKKVENALLRGDLSKMPCCRCGSPNAHAHHDDYDKPLDIMWLCPAHHGERHRELRSRDSATTVVVRDLPA